MAASSTVICFNTMVLFIRQRVVISAQFDMFVVVLNSSIAVNCGCVVQSYGSIKQTLLQVCCMLAPRHRLYVRILFMLNISRLFFSQYRLTVPNKVDGLPTYRYCSSLVFFVPCRRTIFQRFLWRGLWCAPFHGHSLNDDPSLSYDFFQIHRALLDNPNDRLVPTCFLYHHSLPI